MITFRNLVFTRHPTINNSTQARVRFDNGYAVSVACGNYDTTGFHSNGVDTFEVMVYHGVLILDKLKGFKTAEEVTKLMLHVQTW
jgi:hypothetical protein